MLSESTQSRSLRNQNKTCVDTRIWVRENGSSLDFNSLLNSMVDENWVCQHHLLQFILRKWCCVQCSEPCKCTKCLNFFGVCAQTDLFIIFICSLYSLWATIRLLHHQFWLCMCINFRLRCTHFSCQWRKIRHGSHRLTQISKRQCDPWFT